MEVLVLGMHRSGTSAVGAVLELLGLNWGKFGEGLPADEDNPKGYWERKDIVELNDFLLEVCEGRWDKVSKFSLAQLSSENRDKFHRKAKLILENFHDKEPFFIKDPRLCLTLKEWVPLLSKPVGLLVYRDPLQVAQSLAKRNSMPIPVGLALWQFYWHSVSSGLGRLPFFVIYHEELMKNPVEVVHQLFSFLQKNGGSKLELPETESILALIEPTLFRHRGRCEEQMNLMSAQQLQLMQDFEHRKNIKEINFEELSDQAWEWLKFYEETVMIREGLEKQLLQLQIEHKITSKKLEQLWRKSESWLRSLYQEVDRLLDSKEYRVGNAVLLKRLRLKKREKGHLIDQIIAKFEALKQELKK